MACQKFTSSSSATGAAVPVATSIISTPANNHRQYPYQQVQPQEPPIPYILYLHREEVRKRKASFMRISRTKFQLTHELITKTVKNIHKCSADDLQILSRETIFKKNLRKQIARMKHFQYMQMIKHQQQQNEKFQKQLGPVKHHPQQHHHPQHPHHQQHQKQKNIEVCVMEGIETSTQSLRG